MSPNSYSNVFDGCDRASDKQLVSVYNIDTIYARTLWLQEFITLTYAMHNLSSTYVKFFKNSFTLNDIYKLQSLLQLFFYIMATSSRTLCYRGLT